jgi:hypothetical protein
MPDTLTNDQLQQISEGLAALDGLRKGKDEFEPFQFCADTTWLIASNQVAVVEKLKIFDKAKRLLATQHGIKEGMPVTKDNSEQVQAFMEGLSSLGDAAVSFDGLQKIPRANLNVGNDAKKNRIPPSVLAKLMPILEG